MAFKVHQRNVNSLAKLEMNNQIALHFLLVGEVSAPLPTLRVALAEMLLTRYNNSALKLTGMAAFLSRVHPNGLADITFNLGSVMWGHCPAFHHHVQSGCQVWTPCSLDCEWTGAVTWGDSTTRHLTNGMGRTEPSNSKLSFQRRQCHLESWVM